MSAGEAPRPCLALDLVAWVARHGAGTAADLALRFALPEGSILPALSRAVERALLRPRGVLVAEPEMFVATPAGMRAVGLSRLPVRALSARTEGHLRTVVRVAARLEREHEGSCVVWSERELELHNRFCAARGARRIASPYVHHAGGFRKRPDLLLKPLSAAAGLPVAVEVELSRKGAARLRAICLAWKHCPTVGGVLYLVAPDLLEPVGAAIRDAGAQERITLVALASRDVPRLRRREYYRSQPAVCRAAIRPAATRSCGSARATPQLRALLRLVGRLGVVPLDVIVSSLGERACDVPGLIGQAHDAGLLRGALILRRERPLYWATASGLRLAGLAQLPVCRVNYCSAATYTAHARVAASLERERRGRVLSHRELRAAARLAAGFGRAPVAYGPAGGALALGRHRVPALLLVEPRGSHRLPTAVLVEAGAFPRSRLRPVLAAWAASPAVAGTLLCAGRPGVRRVAARVVLELGIAGRVGVRPIPGPGSIPGGWPSGVS